MSHINVLHGFQYLNENQNLVYVPHIYGTLLIEEINND